jgi:hypothetical protein
MNTFTKTELPAGLNTVMDGATFLNKDFSSTTLPKLNITGGLFRRCNFQATAFYGCTFTNCEFNNCNFQFTDLLNVSFQNCSFTETDFSGSTMQDVTFQSDTTVFLHNCLFNDIEKIGNVIGLPDIIEEKKDKDADAEVIAKIDPARTFTINANGWEVSIGDASLAIIKEGKTYRVFVEYIGDETTPECAYSNTLEEFTVEELQSMLLAIKESIATVPKFLAGYGPKFIEDAGKIFDSLNLTETITEETEDFSALPDAEKINFLYKKLMELEAKLG